MKYQMLIKTLKKISSSAKALLGFLYLPVTGLNITSVVGTAKTGLATFPVAKG